MMRLTFIDRLNFLMRLWTFVVNVANGPRVTLLNVVALGWWMMNCVTENVGFLLFI